MADSETLLEVRGLKKHFGGLKAVDGVDLTVKRGETLGLIGPNGAGKTTFFNMVCGFYTPTEGTIRLNGEEIQGLPAHAVARKGIARTFQITKVFKDMTVEDNLLAAFALKRSPSLLSSLRRSHTRQNLAEVMEYLERVDIAAFAKVKAGDLVKELSKITGGNGGGRPDFAQAGGKEGKLVPEALEMAKKILSEKL